MIEGYFDQIYYRFSKEGNNPLGNIFAIHGLGGHSMWFDNAATSFNKYNINFFAFDLPGFGQSKHIKGTIDSYKTWINVSKEILQKFLIHFEIKAPVFILGHSMGGLVAIELSKKVKANGWIISVPGFDGNPHSWPFVDFIIPVLIKSIFKQNENVMVPFGTELLSKNKETQLKVKKDPLRIINLSAKIYKELFFLTLIAKMSVKQFNEPVIFLQAGCDEVCSNSSMDKYFNEIKSHDKCKKVYTNAFHDLFIEDELPQIVVDIAHWIKDRV